MVTKHLASWSHGLRFADLPRPVVLAAIRSFYNWAGCAIGGSQHEATTVAHAALKPFFGPPSATLIGYPPTDDLDAQHAALLNGIASHVHDYDDTHLDTIIHPTGPVASALLAAAQWKPGPFSGADFLVALVAGIEAECKVGLAVWPQHYDVGWHITSTSGSIGAAVAVAKLLGLSVTQTCHAIGIAATQVVGLREMFGSHTKSFHPGRAAQNGLIAAVMAQGGYTSSEQALEAKRGWANVVGATKPDPQGGLKQWVGPSEDAEQKALGLVDTTTAVGAEVAPGRWEILRNSFKPFPCGIVIHPIIDACASLHKELQAKNIPVDKITSVVAKVHPLVLELTGKKTPSDGLQAKFSVFHSGACGLVFGRATPFEYEDAVVRDPKVVAVRDRIDALVDDKIRPDEAIVTATIEGGETLEKHVVHAVGSTEVPLDDAMLETKFMGQAVPVLGEEKAKAASKALWDIESTKDVSAVIKTLA